jgi:hypothetical protein
VSISAFRRRAWTQWFAGLLLAAWLVPIAAPHADDDPLCSPGAGTGTLGVRAQAAADAAPHHCVICHSLRSSRSPSDCDTPATVVTSERHRAAEHPRATCAPALAQLPARAPPPLI